VCGRRRTYEESVGQQLDGIFVVRRPRSTSAAADLVGRQHAYDWVESAVCDRSAAALKGIIDAFIDLCGRIVDPLGTGFPVTRFAVVAAASWRNRCYGLQVRTK
jgi:hypothetical protein